MRSPAGTAPRRGCGGGGGGAPDGRPPPPPPLAAAALAVALAAAGWLGPRAGWWGQGWRAHAQAGARVAPTCPAAAAAAAAWAAALSSDARADANAGTAWRASPALGRFAHFDVLPTLWASAPLRAYGGGDGGAGAAADGDGKKRLVALDYLPAAARGGDAGAAPPCVVYSFGGNAEVAFEAALLAAHPHCSVWQFDCTVTPGRQADALARVPPADRARLHFLPYCVGDEGVDAVIGAYGAASAPTRTTLRSVWSVMAELGHARVDVLKLDVEGAEHGAVRAFLADAARARARLPAQVALELHARGGGPAASLGPALALARAGYALASREDNAFGYEGCCTELVFVRCADVGAE